MLFRRSRSAAPRTRVIPLLGFALATMAPTFVNGCSPDDLEDDPVPLTRIHTDRTYIRDAYGRYSFFHGVNVSGSNKVPTSVDPQTDIPTYVGSPSRSRSRIAR